MPTAFTTTATEVLRDRDLRDVRIVITGATGGLGLASAKALAAAGADLVLLGRDSARLDRAVNAVDDRGSGSVTGLEVDLTDLEQVRQAVSSLNNSLDTLDILILNAGVMGPPLERTAQGHESQFGVNYLAHFALVKGLLPLLVRSHARVVNVSSSAHANSGINFDDPNFNSRDYDPMAAYGQSKSANALLAISLADQYGDQGLTAVSVHPGVIETGLQKYQDEQTRAMMIAWCTDNGELRSIDAGAASIVWASVNDESADTNGSYVADCRIANELREPHASSTEDAQRLWELSEALLRL